MCVLQEPQSQVWRRETILPDLRVKEESSQSATRGSLPIFAWSNPFAVALYSVRISGVERLGGSPSNRI